MKSLRPLMSIDLDHVAARAVPFAPMRPPAGAKSLAPHRYVVAALARAHLQLGPLWQALLPAAFPLDVIIVWQVTTEKRSLPPQVMPDLVTVLSTDWDPT